MPCLRSSAAKATELSWDAFPEPTPESGGWQPDPDSIPVAGNLPDPRFNKDPLTERQKLASKHDGRFGLTNDGSTTSTGVISPTGSTSMTTAPTRVGKWTIPAPRATGLTRSFAPNINNDWHSSVSMQHEASKFVKAAREAPAVEPFMGRVTRPVPKLTNGSKGTVETLPVRPPFRRPLTPAASVASQKPEPPSKTPTPAWVRPLAHLLGESPPKPASLGRLLPVQNRSTTAPSTSVPPHLRKQIKASYQTAAEAGSSKYQAGSLNSKNLVSAEPESTKAAPATKPEYHINSKQLTPQYNSSPLQRPKQADVESPKLGDDFQLQKMLLESFIPKNSDLSTQQHRRYLNTKLISLMEDEMDMQRRTTRQELHNMSDKELDRHLVKITSVHKLTWEDEQNNIRHGEADTKTVMVDLQQHEQCQFDQNRQKTGHPSEPANTFFKPPFCP